MTDQSKYRVVALTCPGPRQEHLLRRLATRYDLAGWVSMSQKPESFGQRSIRLWQRYRNPLRLCRHYEARSKYRQFINEARPLEANLFEAEHDFPALRANLPYMHTQDVNEPSCVNFIQQLQPDCLVVSGTNLLRAPYFDGTLPHDINIVNIHTGLSPYARGGNCNLFCILHSQPQLVGVTVHHIDKGIDSGDIIYSARPTFKLGDTFERLELKVHRLGEDLLMLALDQLIVGKAPRHPQLQQGRLFLYRTGYVYNPYHRCDANERLSNCGLIEMYLKRQAYFDEHVRLFEPSIESSFWRHPLT